jgi:hypothetical protein
VTWMPQIYIFRTEAPWTMRHFRSPVVLLQQSRPVYWTCNLLTHSNGLYEPILWNRVLLEKQIAAQLFNKFAIHETWYFILVFKWVRHWTLSWAPWLHSRSSCPSFQDHFNVTLPLSLDFLRSRFTSGFSL